MTSKEEQVRELSRILGHIKVPASDGFPEVNMVMMGPVNRIAEWMFDQGVRIDRPHVGS
ncbi:hypothetical protein [Corynebacterium accolens]|uniref:hypothetical protein n=1 Tax=Corynebacterium accolens TaxID=38284 RepID=UPI00266F64D2|nr:hypothetical protein [Corynebacterium accolens]WKS54893.1 hypothetical protein NLL31_06590 [Corynebacterium accolens]